MRNSRRYSQVSTSLVDFTGPQTKIAASLVIPIRCRKTGNLNFIKLPRDDIMLYFSGQEHKGTRSNTALKIKLYSPNYQYSGNCNTNVQRQNRKAFKRGGASNQDLFLLLQLFLKSF